MVNITKNILVNKTKKYYSPKNVYFSDSKYPLSCAVTAFHTQNCRGSSREYFWISRANIDWVNLPK